MIRVPKGATKNKRIVGRGKAAKRGRSCGRGHDGQNSRSGGGVRPGFEGGQMPLYRRIARRGFSNYLFKKTFQEVNISTLERVFSDGDTVTLESLIERKVLRNGKYPVKVLGNGEVQKKLAVNVAKVTKGAAAKITAAGGSVTETMAAGNDAHTQTASKETTKSENASEA